MPKKTKALKFIPGKGYAELVKKIKSEFSALEALFKQLSAKCYWRVGEHIHKHILQNKDRADYGQYIYDLLAEDLGREKSTLQRAVQFFLAYPVIIGTCQQLNWSIYRKLITVHDEDERKKLEEQIIKKGWDARKLQEYLNTKRALEAQKYSDKPIPQLETTRSRLYTYQILEPSYVHAQEGEMVVDVGFSNNTQVEARGLKLKAGELVESIKTDNSYKLNHSYAKPKELYTYVALVERVVDGDTQWLNIDCGFKVWTRKKVRLRGIDCPELSTKEGQAAKRFVEARLKEVSFIVVKTYKEEKYGRYLTDVFYLKGEADPQKVLEEGTFLNQELLDKEMARVWSD